MMRVAGACGDVLVLFLVRHETTAEVEASHHQPANRAIFLQVGSPSRLRSLKST